MKAAGVAWKQIFRQSDISHALKENIATTHEPQTKGKGRKTTPEHEIGRKMPSSTRKSILSAQYALRPK